MLMELYSAEPFPFQGGAMSMNHGKKAHPVDCKK
jgi:hypothetical protein